MMSKDDERLQSYPREQVTSGRAIGQIIHAAYGIGMDGTPVQPSTLGDLRSQGFTDKEIDIALKSALFLETMKALAPDITQGRFIPVDTAYRSFLGDKPYFFQNPHDLRNEYGKFDRSKLKVYINGLITTYGFRVWTGSFRQDHPNAFSILYQMSNNKDIPAEKVDVMTGLDFGLDIILAAHTFIQNNGGGKKFGESMAASLPVLYQVASHNMDTKSNPDLMVGKAFVKYTDEEQENVLREKACREIETLPLDTQIALAKLVAMKTWQYSAITLEQAQTMGEAIKVLYTEVDKHHLLPYVSGLRKIPDTVAIAKKSRDYFENIANVFGIKYLNLVASESDIPLTTKQENILIELEHIGNLFSLSDTFFEAIPVSKGESTQIQMKKAQDGDRDRAKELLFREPIVVIDTHGDAGTLQKPADLVIPISKTVKCAALHSVLPAHQAEAVRELGKSLGFEPKQINGISFVALLDVLVTAQVEQALAA